MAGGVRGGNKSADKNMIARNCSVVNRKLFITADSPRNFATIPPVFQNGELRGATRGKRKTAGTYVPAVVIFSCLDAALQKIEINP